MAKGKPRSKQRPNAAEPRKRPLLKAMLLGCVVVFAGGLVVGFAIGQALAPSREEVAAAHRRAEEAQQLANEMSDVIDRLEAAQQQLQAAPPGSVRFMGVVLTPADATLYPDLAMAVRAEQLVRLNLATERDRTLMIALYAIVTETNPTTPEEMNAAVHEAMRRTQ